VRGQKSLKSRFVSTLPDIGSKKLGQPVPLSYLASLRKSGLWHAAHTNVPARFSPLSGLVPARSVPSSKSTPYASGERRARHSAFDIATFAPPSFVV
jgi:hypothetical protein